MEYGGFKIGDQVKFKDEFGREQAGKIVRLVPKGEYSSSEQSVAINTESGFGAYFRAISEIHKA